MSLPDPGTLTLLLGASLFAGFIDAVVGGGGLILIPAMLVAIPTLPPATALGTNKVAAFAGTIAAAINYLRKIPIPKRPVAIAMATAFVLSAVGALLATVIDPSVMRPVIIVAVVAVGVYVALRPEFGKDAAVLPRATTRWYLVSLIAAAVIGFYDGVFGPGTGMFLIIAFTSILGTSFLTSAAAAKVVNVATNAGALLIFGLGGHIWLTLGLVLAVANIAGSMLGSRLVLAKGTALVRAALLIIVVALAIKLTIDQFE
ncbi:hypothetical protein BSZ39_11590 [Bowdeniella nasicola]|uniref:Probable membrane transporter protein n=1 Tax=Bowdeniella nasicola TaxID=208480 RepID=A0A1Q5PZJ2_9ACTO|nr:TSUP family transporter [Bowdeniella nasicola]OKL53048.1 hypothetical protein BSZ39_11590 [Bowdeniella nasicola]